MALSGNVLHHKVTYTAGWLKFEFTLIMAKTQLKATISLWLVSAMI